ncbi:hypothetical protein PAPYR_395 [Paratrimastix pyriformis]|uniref:Uncharacterized protein n=1 Tax=Paratrimastix pyriformis TaxID=342808 RepID=A0ABQ8UVL6_9EUKA|nr:hypothetical protein PAPYR_395 [Paratrimastix pyriformis]
MDINRKLNLNRYRLLNLSCRNKAKSRRTQMPPLINNLSKCGNRFCWLPEYQQQFAAAVNSIGINVVTPKMLLEVLNIPGLTRDIVASHLQKVCSHQARDQFHFCQCACMCSHCAARTMARLAYHISTGKPATPVNVPTTDSLLLSLTGSRTGARVDSSPVVSIVNVPTTASGPAIAPVPTVAPVSTVAPVPASSPSVPECPAIPNLAAPKDLVPALRVSLVSALPPRKRSRMDPNSNTTSTSTPTFNNTNFNANPNSANSIHSFHHSTSLVIDRRSHGFVCFQTFFSFATLMFLVGFSSISTARPNILRRMTGQTLGALLLRRNDASIITVRIINSHPR